MTASLNLYNDALVITEILLFAIFVTLIYLVIANIVKNRRQNRPSKIVSSSDISSDDVSEDRVDAGIDDASDTSSQPENENDRYRYRRLLLDTLRKLNCTPELSPDGEDIFIKYQGESFLIRQSKSFIRIWDLPFAQMNVLDTNLPVLLESINSVNNNIGPKIIVSPANDKGVREILSLMDLLFVPSIINPDQYLASIFQMFFGIKEELRQEIAKWKTNSEDMLSIYSYAASFLN